MTPRKQIDKVVTRELYEQGLIKYANNYPHFVCVRKIFDPTKQFYQALAEDLHKQRRKDKYQE